MPSMDSKEALLSGFQNTPAPRWSDTDLPALHRKRYNHRAVVLQGRALVVGGYQDEEGKETLRSVEMYENQNKCKKLSKLNHPRAEHATVTFGNNVVCVLGGYSNEAGCLDSIEFMNLSSKTPTWQVLNVKLPSKRRGCTGVAVGTLIYIIGGKSAENYCLDTVDVLDTSSNKLFKGPSLIMRRYGSSSAVVGSTIYVVGGQDGAGKTLDTIESLQLNNGKASWQACAFTLSTARVYPAITTVSHCLIVVGGRRDGNQGELASVEVVDTKRACVWNLSPLRQARYACSVITLKNSHLVVMGGYSSITGVYGSMEALNLDSLPIQTRIAVVERELHHVRRGTSLKGLFGGTKATMNKSKGSSLKSLLKELKLQADSQDDADSWQSSDDDELPS